MNNGHLTDAEIQKSVFDAANTESYISQHLEHCAICRAIAREYIEEFKMFGELERPAFEFDLEALVMSGLPVKKNKPAPLPLFAGLLIFVGLCSGLAFYVFRKYLYNMFTGFSSILIYLMAATAFTFLVFQALESYKQYRRKIKDLNFY